MICEEDMMSASATYSDPPGFTLLALPSALEFGL